MNEYIFTFHLPGGSDDIVVYADNLDDARQLAEAKGASFETCETCGDSEWFLLIENDNVRCRQ
jgi:hypothetical protein